MRSRLQLACCQLLFLSTIASSAQTPPTTTDVTINENQSMDESVELPMAEANRDPTLHAMSRAHQATEDEVWKHAMEDTSFQSFYQATKEANQVHEAWDEDSLEDWMATYQLPTWEANHHHIVMGTLDEVSKYPTEGSSDPNQSLEARGQDGTTMYQPPTAEANYHHTIDATWTLEDATTETTRPLTTWAVDEAWKDALEGSSFQTAASNNVPLEYQDTVEANQATKEANQVLTREMEQDQDSLEDWMMTYQLPTLEANHHHTITGTLDEVSKYPMEGSSDPNQSLEASVQDGTTMYQPPTAKANYHHTIDATWTLENATTETTRPLTTWEVDEAWKYALEGSSFQLAASNNVPLEYQDTVESNQAQTLPTWLDQEQATVDVDAPSMMALNALAINTRIAPPPSRMCHICNISESPVWHECSDSVFLCDPCCLIFYSGKRRLAEGNQSLQTSKSGKPFSVTRRAIKSRKLRALETPQKRAERLQADRNRKRAKTAERRARVQEPNQIEGESSQKKSKS